MRSSKSERRSALYQAGALTSTAVILTSLRKPADADELRIPIEELRSDAAELALLQDARREGRIPETFFDAQLHQLDRTQQDSFRKLTALHVQPTLATVHREAAGLGQQLQRSFVAQRGGDAAAPDPRNPGDRLDLLARGLRH